MQAHATSPRPLDEAAAPGRHARDDGTPLARLHRLLLVAVTLPALFAANAAAAAVPNDLNYTITPAGRSLAREFALRGGDLPAEFHALPVAQVDSLLRCPGMPFTLRDLTVNGRQAFAYSYVKSDRGLAIVAGTADIFATTHQADALFARLMKPALVACVERELNPPSSIHPTTTEQANSAPQQTDTQQAGPVPQQPNGPQLGSPQPPTSTLISGAKPVVLSHSFHTIPGVAAETRELRIVFGLQLAQRQLEVGFALAAAHRGRAFALVLTVDVINGSVHAPPASTLIARMATRMPTGV